MSVVSLHAARRWPLIISVLVTLPRPLSSVSPSLSRELADRIKHGSLGAEDELDASTLVHRRAMLRSGLHEKSAKCSPQTPPWEVIASATARQPQKMDERPLLNAHVLDRRLASKKRRMHTVRVEGPEDGPSMASARRGNHTGLVQDYEEVKCGADASLVFLHIPKNAGTSIEEAAREHGIDWGSYGDYRGCDLGGHECWADWHQPPSLMYGMNMYTEGTVFCVIRNPFERAVSEYKYIVAQPEYRFEYEGLVEDDGCSAEAVNSFVKSTMHRYQNGERYIQICHMLPQSFYIWGAEEGSDQCQWCTEIIRFEELPGSFNNLMVEYNLPVRLEEEGENKGSCENLSASDLDEEAAALIREVYKEDFERLNYSLEIPKAAT